MSIDIFKRTEPVSPLLLSILNEHAQQCEFKENPQLLVGRQLIERMQTSLILRWL